MKQALLDALLEVQDNPDTVSGICMQAPVVRVRRAYDYYEMVQYLRGLCAQWPEYSGTDSCPVPHPHIAKPGDAYDHTYDLWEGEYGENRKRLLQFLIDTLQAELEA